MYYDPKPRIETITIRASAKPDQQEIMDFKKRVKDALKKGYKPDGEMRKREDGSLAQQFSKTIK